jgi:hypothetical protein
VPRVRGQVAMRARSVLSALVLLAGCLLAVAVTAVATSPQARAGTAPPPPSGWTTVFSDNFAGAAGSAPNPQNWFYDIVTATDTTGASGSTSFSWTVGGSSMCGTANVALDQPTTASSVQSTSFPAADATDGSTSTRWSSAFSDPQWLEVDLVQTMTVCQVTLDWEAAYATAFQIQTSNDDSSWTTIYSTTTGTGGDQTLSLSGAGRYIRMYGTARATQYGYSLWEFQGFASRPSAAIVTAANYASSNSVQTEATADPCCTDDVGYINSSSWLEYTGVNFGSGLTGQLEVRMASDVSGTDIGTIQFRLGSLTATPFATVEVSGTGGWQTWVDTTPFTTSTGGNFVNVNYFRFT